MSIFSKIKGAKKAANKHKEEKARQSPTMVRDAPAPYRHIPTHAAVDALSGAPSSWKEEDRSAIKAQHKRRSMMTRAESGMSTYHGNASYNNSSYNNSTYYGSDLRLVPAMPSKAEMRRSYASSSARHISPLVTKSTCVVDGRSPILLSANALHRRVSRRIRNQLNVIFHIP